MTIKILNKSKKDKVVTFVWKKTTPVIVNTYRRLIINEVPTMAVDEVSFKKNNSALYDEIVAHRIGLIPIKTDLKSYVLPEKCKCEGAGCAKCQLKFTLQAKSEGVVYSSKLKSQDPKVIPVFENMPIVKLLEGQQLQLEATAILGQGKTHAKFSPGTVFYRNYPEIEITKKVDSAKRITELCSKNVFEVKGDSLIVIKDKIEDCDLCNACVNVSNGAIKVSPQPDNFIVTIESFGQLEPKEMLLKATDIFDELLEEFVENLEKVDKEEQEKE